MARTGAAGHGTATTERGAETEEEEREPGSAVGEDERPEEGAMVVRRPWLVPRRRLCRRGAAEGGQARQGCGTATTEHVAKSDEGRRKRA